MITLDVRNAFNSARWDLIIQTLLSIGVPNYLTEIINNYLSNRYLRYSTSDIPKTYKICAGVSQGSVLGPLLWNIMYDKVLMLDIPEEATIIGFADDIAVIVTGRYLDEIELIANEVAHTISEWMKNAGLELAEQKTEAVLITSRRKRETIKIQVGRYEVESKPSLKYLGVIIDARLNYAAHIEYVCQKASNVRIAIERMMPNVGGPKQMKRRLISTVIRSLILYGAPIWSEALKTKYIAKKLLSVYRLCALRICSSYRTTSDDAAHVIAGIIPIDIMADESKRLFDRKIRGEENTNMIRKIERERSMRLWQDRWNESTKARWTYKLIPHIEEWISRKYGEVNYYLTQFLSGHGGYRKYLHRFGLDDSPICPRCPNVTEDPEHVIFRCPRFEAERQSAELTVGLEINPDNIINIMTTRKENWIEICSMIAHIHKELRKEEDIRKQNRSI